ncbi:MULTISPECIES: sigma factor-like helix-turn-helix DNA-binding protein [unclassified Modestobacter]
MRDEVLAPLLARAGPGLLRTAHLLTGDARQARELVVEALAGVAGRDAAVDEGSLRRALVAAHAAWHRRTRVAGAVAGIPALDGLRASGLPGTAAASAPTVPPGEPAAALALLPARERAVLVLRYGDGLTDEQVAAAVGVEPAAVPGEVDRGLARLAERVPGRDPVELLRRELAERAAGAPGPGPELLAAVRDAARSQRWHRAGLVGLLAFVLVVVLVVAVSLG